jgi:serine/threonine protein kinase
MELSCCNCFSSQPEEPDTIHPTTSLGGQTHLDFRVFSYNELKIATCWFSKKIGQGSIGSVFKGQLKNGTAIAVKVLSIEVGSMQGEREFISELSALSNIKHENLITLKGCCVDGTKRYLVYDYMENNSLAHTLLSSEQNRKKFSWKMRKDVSLEVASALAYLHEEVSPHIVHRDIKSGNVLLDRNFRPKVSDFGLSKIFNENRSHISTRVAGTLGYLAPEYAISGHLTRKSDVYSFGVLILDIVTGHPAVIFNLERGERYLVQEVWEAYNAKNLVELIDFTLENNYPEEEAVRFLKLGLLCVQETARLRPRMLTAFKMLNNEIDISEVNILQPGLVADLMDIKQGQNNLSQSTASKDSSLGMSSQPPSF